MWLLPLIDLVAVAVGQRLPEREVGADEAALDPRVVVHRQGPGVQVREVRGREGYGIMNSLNAHFGLGAVTRIDRLVIRWPSGTVSSSAGPLRRTPIWPTQPGLRW